MTQDHRDRRIAVIAAGLILLAGFGLRAASFTWNTAIKGDVNLMALSAREFIQHDRLYYPMLYAVREYQPMMTLDPIGSPAVQHPPLYPFLAGVMGKLAGSDDTFTFLKIIDLVCGVALTAAVIATGWGRKPDPGWLAAGALVSLSPLLVDFSANGSPYICVTLAIGLSTLLMRSGRLESLRHYALAGLVCGLGLQFHTIAIGLPAAFLVFWLIERKRVRPAGIGIFALVLIATLLPWMAWSMSLFGTPFAATSGGYFLRRVGISSLSQLAEPENAWRYLQILGKVDLGYFTTWYDLLGPFVLALAVVGIAALIRRWRSVGRVEALAVLLPVGSYSALALAWPLFEMRFVVPTLLLPIMLAGIGFGWLAELIPAKQRAAWIAAGLLLAGGIGWQVAGLFRTPPTRYYKAGEEALIAQNYPLMQALAVELGQQQRAMVVCISVRLDNGKETVYWSRMPTAFSSVNDEALKNKVALYHPRYIWADNRTQERVTRLFPDARMILSSGPFFVYELSQ